MAIAAPLPIVSVTGVLTSLGFTPSGNGLGHLVFDFGNLVLRALPCTNEYCAPVVLFSGLYQDSRSLRQISFEMPDRVESPLQVQAWVAYGIGREFRPRRASPWLVEGAMAQDVLPWEREMHAYKARPRVLVPRSWMRLAAQEIREAADIAPERQVCVIEFDGRVLIFDLGRRVIPLPAEGDRPWEHSFSPRLKRLSVLPRRWMRDPVPIDVWKERIRFGNLYLDLSTEANT